MTIFVQMIGSITCKKVKKDAEDAISYKEIVSEETQRLRDRESRRIKELEDEKIRELEAERLKWRN